MPSSSVHTFTEPDEYAAAIRATTIGLTVTGRGKFNGKRVRIDFHRLWMQRLFENQARALHSSFVPGRAIVTFGISRGSSLVWGGSAIQPTNLIRHSEAEEAFQYASGPTNWGAMSLPVADMVSFGAAVAGVDLTPPDSPLVLVPAPSAIARLQRLHEAAGNLAEDAPKVLAHPEASRGLEQALIEAMLDCVGGNETSEDRSSVRQHAAIMRRFHRVVEECANQPLYIPELCREVGTSLRTLQVCCQEHLGMSPKHYLLLRRMNLFRQTLRESRPIDATVTEVATQYGFWQFGRLAVEYKALFGESPSATLSRRAA
jgi:AraC-like DNA-binding protein